jgi:hypothetical protein
MPAALRRIGPLNWPAKTRLPPLNACALDMSRAQNRTTLTPLASKVVAVSAYSRQVMSQRPSALMNDCERNDLQGMRRALRAVAHVAAVLLYAVRQQTA